MFKNCVTVRDLKLAIEYLPDDMPVVVTSDYGDRNHTEQVHSNLDFGTLGQFGLRVYSSGYSTSGYAVREASEEGEASEENQIFIIRT